MSARLLTRIDELMAGALPVPWYIAMQDALRPLLRPGLTSKGRRVERLGDCLRVVWDDGTDIHFAHPLRYARYMHRQGRAFIFNRLLEKYQDADATVQPGDVVVDIGANVGEFTCAVANLASRVVAVEPDPAVLASLEKNISRYPNVVVVPDAAAKRHGNLEFFIKTDTADSSLIEPLKWNKRVDITCRPLSEILERTAVPRVDFLKVEAEGYEPEVLEGAASALHLIRKIAIDCGPERRGRTTRADCESILWQHGFRTWSKDGRPNTLFAVPVAS